MTGEQIADRLHDRSNGNWLDCSNVRRTWIARLVPLSSAFG